MTREEFNRSNFKRVGFFSLYGWYLVLMLTMLGVALLLAGCKTVYVPVKEIHTEYITKHDSVLKSDSVYLHDSVYIHAKNDTVFFEKWHTKYRDRIKEVVRIDSFIKNDSIPIPYPVERKLNLWERTKMDFGGIAIVIALISFIFVGFRTLRWLQRKRLQKV